MFHVCEDLSNNVCEDEVNRLTLTQNVNDAGRLPNYQSISRNFPRKSNLPVWECD